MKDFFEDYAAEYDATLNRTVRLSGEETEFFIELKIRLICKEIIRRQFALRSILDFGCGTGNAFKSVRKYINKAKYSGVDTSCQSIEYACKKWGREWFQQYDGIRLPFADRNFDLAFASVVFHHIPFERHLSVLSEIHRVLRPGGLFFVFEHNAYHPLVRKVVRDCPFDCEARLLSSRYTKKLFTQSPFRHYNLRYYLFFPSFLKFLRCLESYLYPIPFGAQYYIVAEKNTAKDKR